MRYLYLAVAIILLSFASAAAKSEAEVVTTIEDVAPAESERIIRYMRVREANLIRDMSQMYMAQKLRDLCGSSNQVWIDTNADGVRETKLQCFVVEVLEPEK